jgi:small redox-active disulfide protein 2
MKIQILGTGCPKCNQLYQNAQQAVAEAGIEASVEKVTNLNDIMTFGVMVTPALAIDGRVKAYGKIPTVDDIKKMICEKRGLP